jgi:XTP/dITP diphosphohydrolase
MKTVYFITSNKGKVGEATQKLAPLGFRVVQKDLGYPEIQADSLEEVAQYGVEQVRERFDKPFMLEDAGVFIQALEGFPGVYSKYVFFTIGLPGVLRLLEGVQNRSAVFRSVFAYHEPEKKPLICIGECLGTIIQKCRGTNGFGYDPLFVPHNATKTFAEMSVDEKNQYSHRAKALEMLVMELRKRQLK